MDRKLLKTVQTITTFWNRLADPVGTRRGPPLVRGPQFENRCSKGREEGREQQEGGEKGRGEEEGKGREDEGPGHQIFWPRTALRLRLVSC